MEVEGTGHRCQSINVAARELVKFSQRMPDPLGYIDEVTTALLIEGARTGCWTVPQVLRAFDRAQRARAKGTTRG